MFVLPNETLPVFETPTSNQSKAAQSMLSNL